MELSSALGTLGASSARFHRLSGAYIPSANDFYRFVTPLVGVALQEVHGSDADLAWLRKRMPQYEYICIYIYVYING